MQDKKIKKLNWIWSSIRQRCLNPKNPAFKNYGARGIGIDQRWDKFKNFMHDMGIPANGWTIDRIDNDLGYSIENCVWSKRIAQTRNRRNTKIYEIDGGKYTLKEYSILKNLNYNSIKTRIQKGMTIEEAIFEGKYPNNNIYGKDLSGKFISKNFHGRLCAIEERNRGK